MIAFFFFFNDTATTEIYTLSLHDALPISLCRRARARRCLLEQAFGLHRGRSEEHTSELQSRLHLVCRLLLEKKKHELRAYDDTTTTPLTSLDLYRPHSHSRPTNTLGPFSS